MSVEFVGDLSIADAKLLAQLGVESAHILEFGVGGSTQIFAQGLPAGLTCVDTDAGWVERTKTNLARITSPFTAPSFVPYDLFRFEGVYDLIFVDGAPEKRLDFAMRAWPLLVTGGRMVFHDTRRFEYFKEAAWLVQSFFAEVRRVEVNPANTNLTVIAKGVPVLYENWNVTEGKPLWAYGAEPMPEGEKLWKLES